MKKESLLCRPKQKIGVICQMCDVIMRTKVTGTHTFGSLVRYRFFSYIL